MQSSTFQPHCVFCRIVADEEPASVIYEDEETMAFMDINPVTHGHALVIPKAHVVDIYGASDRQAATMMITGAKVARALKAALDCAGVNFWMANERPAGQVVMHAHLHVIPRYLNDGFGVRRWAAGKRLTHAELSELAERVARHVKDSCGG